MLPVDGSIAPYAYLLPVPGGADTTERLALLAAELEKPGLPDTGLQCFAEEALNALPGEQLGVNGIKCLLSLCTRHYQSGQPRLALDLAARAAALGEAIPGPLTKKIFNCLGVIRRETGDYPGALAAFKVALKFARSDGDENDFAGILCNLGAAHMHAWQYSSAIQCFESALQHLQRAGIRYGLALGVACDNLALACIHVKDFARGLSAVKRAVDALASPNETHERLVRVLAEYHFVRLLVETNNVQAAASHAQAALYFAKETGPVAQLFAEMSQGIVELHFPETRASGQVRLQSLVNRSRETVPSALRDALSVIIRAYQIIGQPNAALVYYHELETLHRETRIQNVLFHHERHLNSLLHRWNDAAAKALHEQREDLKHMRLSMDQFQECIAVLMRNTVAVEMHEDETGEHCYRVGRLARLLAQDAGMDEEVCYLIDISARLHDVGKLDVPTEILYKPGKFTPEERAMMEKHCEYGWHTLVKGGVGQLFVAAEIAFSHHEKFDGTGYPQRRVGTMIPLTARITAIVDVFDALTHKRCYKPAWSVEDALREISAQSGKQFDPELVQLFLELVPRLQHEHGDLDLYLGMAAREDQFVKDQKEIASSLNT